MQIPLKHIIAEIRPTLQSVNVYATFSLNIASQCKVELTKDGFDIIYDVVRKQLQFYDCMKKENLIILSARKNYLVFRFSISNVSIRGCLKAEVLNLESDIDKLQLNDMSADKVESIKCSNGCILNTQEIKRAFRSPHFDYEPSAWFCHAHNIPDYSVMPNIFELQITDNGFYIDKQMVDNCVYNVDKNLTCKNCSSYLGKEMYKGIYKFYPDTVYTDSGKINTFCADTGPFQIQSLSLESKAELASSTMDVVSLDIDNRPSKNSDKNVSLTSTLKIVRDGADRNLGKVILTCQELNTKEKQYLLIWLIDKNLLTYQINNEDAFTAEYVNKVLFQYEDGFTETVDQWCKDFNTILIDISPSMMRETVKHLVEMNSIIPEEYGSANGFCVSFFST